MFGWGDHRALREIRKAAEEACEAAQETRHEVGRLLERLENPPAPRLQPGSPEYLAQMAAVGRAARAGLDAVREARLLEEMTSAYAEIRTVPGGATVWSEGVEVAPPRAIDAAARYEEPGRGW